MSPECQRYTVQMLSLIQWNRNFVDTKRIPNSIEILVIMIGLTNGHNNLPHCLVSDKVMLSCR